MKTTDLVDAMVDAAELALRFGRVDRVTYHPDGKTLESDTDHTVMLGIVACALVDHFPWLDRGAVAQYALVHDLVETYAGDTPTLRMPTAEATAAKRAREDAAFQRIDQEFVQTMPWLPDTIAHYESRSTPEARFVKAVDKMLPKLTHILNSGQTLHDEGVDSDALAARLAVQVKEMQAYASDFPGLFDLYAELTTRIIPLAAAPEVPC